MAARERYEHALGRRRAALAAVMAGTGTVATWRKWARLTSRYGLVADDYVAEAREMSDVDLYGRMTVPIDDAAEPRRVTPPRPIASWRTTRRRRPARFPMVEAAELMEASR